MRTATITAAAHVDRGGRVMPATEIHVTVEPIQANPGFIASITGHLSDPETDPQGVGATREAAALDLARSLHERGHPCLFLAVAAAMRENLRSAGYDPKYEVMAITAYDRAIRLVEGTA